MNITQFGITKLSFPLARIYPLPTVPILGRLGDGNVRLLVDLAANELDSEPEGETT
jgi:hypothetical protein